VRLWIDTENVCMPTMVERLLRRSMCGCHGLDGGLFGVVDVCF